MLLSHSRDDDVCERLVVLDQEHAHEHKLSGRTLRGYRPSTISSKLLGRIGGRLRGFSGVACAGAAPNRAVTVKSRWSSRSISIVRAPGAVVTVCSAANLPGLFSRTTVIVPSPFDENAKPVPG